MQAKDGLGKYGERVAVQRLVEFGYEILDANWRCGDGELDVVARRDGVVAFVEVKTRSSDEFGEPAEAVGLRKQQKIRELSAIWLRERGAEHGVEAGEISFDVFEVRHSPKGAAKVQHLRQAF